MERIIAGRFQSKDNAAAVAALIARYIDTSGICICNNNAPGEYDAFAADGYEPAGAMAELDMYDDGPRAQEHRRAGVMLSVRTTNPVSEDRVIATLRAAGAADIEPDHCEWHDSARTNFNLAAAPRLVGHSSH